MKKTLRIISYCICASITTWQCSTSTEKSADSSVMYCMVQAPPNNAYYNPSTETYRKINENDFKTVKANPLSTFSIDVDKASYSNIRRFINNGEKPPVDAVRIEEMINYFDYDYPQPKANNPIFINTEITSCPWEKNNKILMIGLQAKKIEADNLPPSNLVFLIDVSGSMDESNKLPLLKSSFKLLVENLRKKDKISIVCYAGQAGVVLPTTDGDDKQKIIQVIESLQAGGSTAGSSGINLAYQLAEDNLIKGGNNRVVLATDGDFNVGISNDNDLEQLITSKRNAGIYLTCLGFGMGNYKDSKMKILAEKGNGNYAYIDNLQEARKNLLSEFGGTIFTVAKDVKIQIEFNPSKIQAYRLIGYENRILNNEDFKDDTKDAGDMGSGHTVTALYEIIPVGVKSNNVRETDNLKYQSSSYKKEFSGSNEFAFVKIRYKNPNDSTSKELNQPVILTNNEFSNSSANLRFATSVALAGMILRDSKYIGIGSIDMVINIASDAKGKDDEGYKAEFIRLINIVKRLS